jgi:hypothetical protein
LANSNDDVVVVKVMLWNSRVWPSAGAFATWSAPIEPPPPPTFSTTTLWPMVSVMCCANSRASMSVVAPAGNGTTMRIDRDG